MTAGASSGRQLDGDVGLARVTHSSCGQRGDRGAPRAGQPPAAPPAKPLIPVATNTVNTNPDAYYGQGVTITASVEQILSKSAFAVDQRRVAGAPAPQKPTDVLVLVPT